MIQRNIKVAFCICLLATLLAGCAGSSKKNETVSSDGSVKSGAVLESNRANQSRFSSDKVPVTPEEYEEYMKSYCQKPKYDVALEKRIEQIVKEDADAFYKRTVFKDATRNSSLSFADDVASHTSLVYKKDSKVSVIKNTDKVFRSAADLSDVDLRLLHNMYVVKAEYMDKHFPGLRNDPRSRTTAVAGSIGLVWKIALNKDNKTVGQILNDEIRQDMRKFNTNIKTVDEEKANKEYELYVNKLYNGNYYDEFAVKCLSTITVELP